VPRASTIVELSSEVLLVPLGSAGALIPGVGVFSGDVAGAGTVPGGSPGDVIPGVG